MTIWHVLSERGCTQNLRAIFQTHQRRFLPRSRSTLPSHLLQNWKRTVRMTKCSWWRSFSRCSFTAITVFYRTYGCGWTKLSSFSHLDPSTHPGLSQHSDTPATLRLISQYNESCSSYSEKPCFPVVITTVIRKSRCLATDFKMSRRLVQYWLKKRWSRSHLPLVHYRNLTKSAVDFEVSNQSYVSS